MDLARQLVFSDDGAWMPDGKMVQAIFKNGKPTMRSSLQGRTLITVAPSASIVATWKYPGAALGVAAVIALPGISASRHRLPRGPGIVSPDQLP